MDRYTQEFPSVSISPPGLLRNTSGKACSKRKIRKLVTDGISASPAELQQEFATEREDKLDYVLIRPKELETKFVPTDAEIRSSV